MNMVHVCVPRAQVAVWDARLSCTGCASDHQPAGLYKSGTHRMDVKVPHMHVCTCAHQSARV